MNYFDFEAVLKDGSTNSTVDPELLDERKQLDNLRSVVSQIAYHMSFLYVLTVLIMVAVFIVVVVQVSFALYTLMKKKGIGPQPSQVVVEEVKKKTEPEKKTTNRSKRNLHCNGPFSPGKILPASETKINVDLEEMDKEVTTAVAPHNQSILETSSIFSNSEQYAQKINSTTAATTLPTSTTTSPALGTAISSQTPFSTK